MTINKQALLVSKAKASVFTMRYISQFEASDIDSDDIDLRFEVDGTETGTTVSIVDECGHAAQIITALLDELEANKPELKIAELINKFYERYPLASFNKDTDRAEALGYFLAGAELQCFGEFIKYEELFGDE